MPTFPTPWQLTPLSSGPLAGDAYSMDINSLSASTVYEYQAYAVIDGTPYYGNVLTGCTLAIPTYKPSACTGNAYFITDASMAIHDNKVLNNGGLPIAEYGFLYTQIGSYGNINCMTYEAFPTKMCKKFTSADIVIGTSYYTGHSCTMLSLASNTLTYFRAFAKNANGVGYGLIENALTLPPPVPLPTITQVRNVGTPGSYRYQDFEIGDGILAGDIFSVMVYSHGVYVTAVAGDTPLSIINKFITAVNATTTTQWNDHNSAPPIGTVGFPPYASLGAGPVLTLRLNYQNQFGASASRP